MLAANAILRARQVSVAIRAAANAAQDQFGATDAEVVFALYLFYESAGVALKMVSPESFKRFEEMKALADTVHPNKRYF